MDNAHTLAPALSSHKHEPEINGNSYTCTHTHSVARTHTHTWRQPHVDCPMEPKFIRFNVHSQKLIYGNFSGKVNFAKRFHSLEEFYTQHIGVCLCVCECRQTKHRHSHTNYESFCPFPSTFWTNCMRRCERCDADAAKYVCVCFCN